MMRNRYFIMIICSGLMAIVGMLSLFGLSLSRCVAQDDNLLDSLKSGSHHAASVVRSGRGQVTISRWRVKPGTRSIVETEDTCDLKFAGDRFRLSVDQLVVRNDPSPDASKSTTVGSRIHREILVDGNRVALLEADKGIIGDRFSNPVGRGVFDAYMPEVGLIGQMLPGNGIIDLSQLSLNSDVRSETTIKVVGRELVDGSECIVLEVVGVSSKSDIANRVVRMWVDPQKGFTTPRVQTFLEGGPFTTRTLAEESNVLLKDRGDGIWFPANVARSYYKKESGGISKYETIVVTYSSDFELNVPVNAGELSLVFPSGTQVTDELLVEQYTVP